MIHSLLSALLPAATVPLVNAFSWFQLLPGFGENDHLAHSIGLHEQEGLSVMATSWLVVGLVLIFALVARAQLQRVQQRTGTDRYIADDTLTARNAGEILVQGLYSLVSGTLSHKDADRFFPFLAGIFTYIFFNNLIGFIPGLPPATESVSGNLAMAAVVFLVFNIAGIARNGLGYIKHLAGPKLPAYLIPVTILVFAIELFSLFLRPATLTIRLSANIFADHLVAGIIRELGDSIPMLGPVTAVLLPLPFFALGLLVCFIQAFVFTLLSTIYLSLAVAHDDGHH